MSSVLKYKRNQSPMEFENNARKLMLYTIQRCGHFPKHYTFYIGIPLANDAREMYSCIKRANANEPKSRIEAQARHGYFKKAVAILWEMVSQIEVAKDLFTISDHIMEEWMGMIDYEFDLLNGIMNHDDHQYANLL